MVNMQLSERDQKILKSIFLDAEKTASEIARETKLHETTVRRVLQRWMREGLLQKAPFLNVYALGLTQYGVFFSIAAKRRRVYEALIQYLLTSERISFLAELGGDIQFAISICASDIEEATGFLDKLSKEFGDIFFEKSVAIRLQLLHYSVKYLASELKDRSTIRWGIGTPRTTIDSLDHRILRELSASPSNSHAELARRLKVPYMTVENRLRMLKQRGVIVGSVCLLNESRLGILPYYLLVYTRGLSQVFKEKLFTLCREHPHVYFLVENFGSWDYELGVYVNNAQEISDITRLLYDHFGEQILAIKVLPVFRYHKVRNYPFISEPKFVDRR